MNNLIQVAVLCIAATLANCAFAQDIGSESGVGLESQTGGTTAFPVEFFVDQNPVNAFDMVGLVPGFVFREGDNSRGFSGAAGNVLINGRRPSAKTTGLRMLLRRIPASEIERIDVIRGGAPGIDMQGLPVVVNVIRRSGTSTISAAEAIAKRYEDDDLGKIFRLEQSTQSDVLLLEGAAEYRAELDENESGEGEIRMFDGAGALSEDGSFSAKNRTELFTASGALAWDTLQGLFRANLAVSSQQDTEDERSVMLAGNGLGSVELVEGDRASSRVEIGGDYSHTLAGGDSIELLALQSLEVEEDESSRADEDSLQQSSEESREGESIMRGTWRRQMSSTMDFEAGVEGAFNFLDSDSRIRRNNLSVPLPAESVLVEETRGEVFSLLTLRPLESVSVGVGLRAETSGISVSGEAQAANRFSFLKPRVVAAYAASGGTQLRLGVEREVGQLDFEDFVAGSEFSSNTINAGNPDLAPEHSWILDAGIERPVFGGGAVNLTYRHARIEDVVDLVLVSGFAAPGNIGKGSRDEIILSLTLPLESYGPGLGRVQLESTWTRSAVTDPVTRDNRRISGEKPFEGRLTYTREFPALNSSFGIIGDLAFKETSYRIDQIITERNSGNWRAYWDWRPRQNLLVRTQLDNLTSRDLRREQRIYEGSRADDVFKEIEVRNARLDAFLMVRVRVTF
jgi:hypothetical protein